MANLLDIGKALKFNIKVAEKYFKTQEALQELKKPETIKPAVKK